MPYKRYLETGRIEDVSESSISRSKKARFNAAESSEPELSCNVNDQSCTINLGTVLNEDITVSHYTVAENEGEDCIHSNNTEPINQAEELLAECDKNAKKSKDEFLSKFDESTQPDAELFQELFEELSQEKHVDWMNDLLRPKSYKHLVENPLFSNKINQLSDKSPGEILIMALKISIFCKLPKSQTAGLFEFANNFFPSPILPDSAYFLDKMFNPKSGIEYHGICPNCNIYVGKIETFESNVTCEFCKEKIDLSNPSCLNVFIIIDPSDAIKTLIENNEEFYNFVMNERKYDGSIKDIFDGKLYRKFVKTFRNQEKHYYLTAILNTDGAPRFERSDYSIWPVYLQVNEIPRKCNGGNVLTLALWFGKGSPDMQAFLEPIVDYLNEKAENGILCSLHGEEVYIPLFTLCTCVDGKARGPTQGIKQYGGYYSCNWCLIRGEHYAGAVRYPAKNRLSQPRTMSTMKRHLEIVANSNPLSKNAPYGVLHATPLINLQKHDIVDGNIPDHLHNALIGTGSQITDCFENDMSQHTIRSMDTLLYRIRIPHQLSRMTKPFSGRAKWQAKEWENFILHYSLPLYKILLKKKYYDYWSLFVNSLYILLKDNITFGELDEADRMLHEFVYTTQKLFTKKEMTYNVHQMLHLATSVMNWGPLFAHSTFTFESANHHLLKAIHSANGVNLQICRFINLQRMVMDLENIIYPFASSAVKQYCMEMSITKTDKSIKISDWRYIGGGLIIPDNLSSFLKIPSNTTLLYKRAIHNGCLYTCNDKNKRSNNSFAQLKDGRIIKLIYFVVNAELKKELILCKMYRTDVKLSSSIFKISQRNRSLTSVDNCKIKQIVVQMDIQSDSYVSLLPNMVHY